MKDHKGCIFALLALALFVSGGVGILVQQRHQEAQTLSAYHASILAQVPCIESVCPGFDEGRDRALEHLATSQIVQGKEQGTHLIGLSFIDNEKKLVGDGVIEFIINDQGVPTTVHQIPFRLHDLKLDVVLSTFGEPDQFLFISGCGMGLRVYAELYYPEQGITVMIEYPTRRPDSQVLAENTPVWAIIYLQPDNLQGYIEESSEGLVGYNVAYDFHSFVTAADIIAQIRPWPGIEVAPRPSADFCPR